MEQRHWVYLFDEEGRGPKTPADLPKKIAELRDDPYRGLAWAVRKQNGFAKTDDPFAEFRWANYLRQRVKIGERPGDFERAVELALPFCRLKDAKDLPGYREPKADGS